MLKHSLTKSRKVHMYHILEMIINRVVYGPAQNMRGLSPLLDILVNITLLDNKRIISGQFASPRTAKPGGVLVSKFVK